MKIAFFVRCMSNGGAERVAAALSIIWTELGHEVFLLTNLPEERNEFDHHCDYRQQIDFDQIDAEGVRRLHEQLQFNVVVFNDAINGLWFDRVFDLVGKLSGVKRVAIVHHPCTNWLYTLGNTADLIKHKYLSQTDALVCVDSIHALWWRYRGCPSIYIPNPAAVGFKRRSEYHSSHRIVWAGRIGDYCKRFDLAIKDFAELAELDPEATLTVLGTTNKRMVRRIMRKISSQAHEQINFTGFIANPDEILSKAALFLFTSCSEATIPQVVLEAQALGVPIIAYDIPDLGLLSEKDGVVKVPENDASMAHCMLKLLRDSKKLHELSAAARNSALRRVEESDVKGRWNSLFVALANNADSEYVKESEAEYSDDITHRRLMDEIHHASLFFVNTHLPMLLRLRRWMCRLDMGYLFGRIICKLCH